MTVKFIHLVTLVIWFGGMFNFSFITAPSIFKILPKEDAGDVVGDIFPKYYFIGYVSSLVLFYTLYQIGGEYLRSKIVISSLLLIGMMTCLTFYSGLVIGSKVRNIKTKVRETTDVAKKEELEVSFKRIHSVSMLLNVSVIGLSVVYLAFVPIILRM